MGYPLGNYKSRKRLKFKKEKLMAKKIVKKVKAAKKTMKKAASKKGK